ncbi:hypothetical protein QZH41_020316 [Actinostola sp. cb2023]|nr:hypothetical protein QZH41_020316 [Actinostola sp. cb2023]
MSTDEVEDDAIDGVHRRDHRDCFVLVFLSFLFIYKGVLVKTVSEWEPIGSVFAVVNAKEPLANCMTTSTITDKITCLTVLQIILDSKP